MFIRYNSHQLRNPLNVVQLGLDTLEVLITQRDECDYVHEHSYVGQLDLLRDVKESLQSSIEILNDMLTSDKIQSGFLSLEKENIDLIAYLKTKMHPFTLQVLQSC